MSGIAPITSGPNAISNPQEMRDRLLARVDTDQNGTVSFEEIEATERGVQFADALRAFDADGSGDLSTEELSQLQQQIAEKVREQFQAQVFYGAEPQALFDALLANEDD